MTFPLSYQYGHKNGVAYFHFEQLSIISVVSLLLTFNKYTASGVLSFSLLSLREKCPNIEFLDTHFTQCMFQNIISGSEHKCTSEHLRRNTKNKRWRENRRKKRNYFIGKYGTS